MSITISIPKGLRARGVGKAQVKKRMARNGDGTKRKGYAMTEFKHGPDPHGPRKCIHCHKAFKAGDNWSKLWDADHQYAIGIHDGCRE